MEGREDLFVVGAVMAFPPSVVHQQEHGVDGNADGQQPVTARPLWGEHLGDGKEHRVHDEKDTELLLPDGALVVAVVAAPLAQQVEDARHQKGDRNGIVQQNGKNKVHNGTPFFQHYTMPPWKKKGRSNKKTSRIEAVASPRPAGYLLLRSHKPLLLGVPHFRSKRFIG